MPSYPPYSHFSTVPYYVLFVLYPWLCCAPIHSSTDSRESLGAILVNSLYILDAGADGRHLSTRAVPMAGGSAAEKLVRYTGAQGDGSVAPIWRTRAVTGP